MKNKDFAELSINKKTISFAWGPENREDQRAFEHFCNLLSCAVPTFTKKRNKSYQENASVALTTPLVKATLVSATTFKKAESIIEKNMGYIYTYLIYYIVNLLTTIGSF